MDRWEVQLFEKALNIKHLHFRQNLQLDLARKKTIYDEMVILPFMENRFHFRKESKFCQGILVLRF